MLSKVGFNSNTNFGRALTTAERKEHDVVWKKAYEVLGKDKTILIAPGFTMPQNPEYITGVGHYGSQESSQALDIFKSYTGANAIEDLPPGQAFTYKNCHIIYAGTSLSLGDSQINPEALTTEKYGKIVTPEELKQIADANTTKSLRSRICKKATKETIVNFENIADKDSAQNKVLKKAFERFKQSSDSSVTQLKEKFEQYKTENNDWLEPKGIFEVLKEKHSSVQECGTNPRFWTDETDKRLYDTDFDASKRQARKEEILKNHADEIEFYKFKQFMAETHLAEGVDVLHQKGLEYIIDQQHGFSRDEIWAHPKAFLKNTDVGWGLRALDYDTIEDESSESSKLLARKTELHARRSDGIRFDVGWSHINQKRIDTSTKKSLPSLYMGDIVIKQIEKAVKKVKGENFDPKKLLYEVEASWEDLQFETGGVLIPPMKNISKIYTGAHMNPEWGSNDAYLRRGFDADYFIIGPGNHDSVALRKIAEADHRDLDKLGHLREMRDIFQKKDKTKEEIQKLADLRKKHNLVNNDKFNAALESLDLKERKIIQSKTVAKILGLDEATLLANPIEFIKAKFAEPIGAKNSMIFFMDVLGRKKRFNNQEITPTKYRYKITSSYESEFHTAVQEGRGFNLMDSLEKVFKARKLDEKHPELYQSIIKFKNILEEKGVTTEKDANEKFGTKNLPTEISQKSKIFKFLAAGTAVLALTIGIWAYNQNSKKEAKMQ